MARVTFKPNIAGFREVRTSAGAVSVCSSAAAGVASQAAAMSNGGAFGIEVQAPTDRCVIAVKPEDRKALRACLRDNVLLKALG